MGMTKHMDGFGAQHPWPRQIFAKKCPEGHDAAVSPIIAAASAHAPPPQGTPEFPHTFCELDPDRN